jgi:tetratricopeptide (TPR) repeat protein
MLARCYREFPPPRPGRAESPDPDPLEKATEVLRKLANDYPDVPDYRYELCETLATPRFPGPRFVAEEDPDAEGRLRTALELSQTLVREHPNIPEYAAAQIHTHHKLAHLLRDTDRPQEAEASLRTVLALQAALVGQFPAVSSHRVWQSVIQESLANLLSERGELNEARSLLEGAIATLNDCQAGEGKPTYSRLLSRNYENLADVLSRLGEREQAEAARRLAQESGFGDGPPPPERRITREPAPP